MSKKVLFITREGNGLPLAHQMEREGAEVRTAIIKPDCREHYKGILKQYNDWTSHITWCDYAVFDDVCMAKEKQIFSEWNKPAFGMGHSKKDMNIDGVKFHGSGFAEAIEDERKFAHDLMHAFGIGVKDESIEVHNVNDAIKHLRDHKVPHVIKPQFSTNDKGTTYVGQMDDNEDAIGWLETFPSRPKSGQIKSLELCERVSGVEVACACNFNGKDWVGPVEINFEHKRFATGDADHLDGLGFFTGEQGTPIYFDSRPFEQIKLFKETLAKLQEVLAAVDYRGNIDLNCIVNKDGIHGLEFTPRMGYPSSFITASLQKTKLSDLLYAVAAGETIDNKVSEDWAIGVVLAGEGYPFWDEGEKRMSGMPFIGYGEQNAKDLYICDVSLWKDRLICTGSYPCVAVGHGKTWKAAKADVYKRVIPQVYFPGEFYRTDIGDRLARDLPILEKLGYDLRTA